MSTVKVVTDELERLAGIMDNLAGRFDGMVQQRVCYAGHADAPAMEAGLHEFFCKWTNGLALLRGQLGAVDRRCRPVPDVRRDHG
jgi:hypothetical protein